MSHLTIEQVLTTWVKEFHETDGDRLDQIFILFDGYGEAEDGSEDKDQLCYVVFVHERSLEDDFIFPEHDSVGGLIVHRPHEEGAYYVWTDAEGQLETFNGPVTDLEPDFIDNIAIELEEKWSC